MSVRLDQAKIHHLVITQDEAKPGIEFSRDNYNYLIAPTGGSIAFSPGSESKAGATTGVGSHLVVSYGEVIPGLNNNLINLGSTSYHWNVIHGKKLALNASEEPLENFYVNGTARFAIGNNDTVGDKRVIVGSSGNRYLSLGGAGIQAYSDADAGSVLYLQYQGGSMTIGQSTSLTSPVTIHGNLLAGAKDTYNIGSEEKPWNMIYGTHSGDVRGVIETNPTSATRYNPLFINTGNGAAVNTTVYTRRTNMDYNIYMLQGTASALGYVILELGNNIAAQTAGNKYGAVRLYNTDTTYADLRGNNIGSYGGFRVSGKKGNYHGILLGDATSGMAVMSMDGSHQGLYNQAKSKWIVHFDGNSSICIGGSTVTENYPIVLNASTNVKGNVVADTTEATDYYMRVQNANGSVRMLTSTNRGLYDDNRSQWIIYSRASDSTTRIPEHLYTDNGYITSSTTMYLSSATNTSLIFRKGTTSHARFDTSGHFIPEATVTYNIGSAAKLWKQMNTHHLQLLGSTNATMTASSTNPRITFAELDGSNNLSQPVHLIYTDYNDYRSPAGLKVIGGESATPAWFEVEGSIYSGRNIYAIHPTGGETNINVAHGTNEYLMLWGNNSSGGRGLWDTTKGSVITVTDTSSTFHGNATTTTSLATGRTLKVDLGSTSASTAFNGSADVHNIGVSGTLGTANGGTGNTSYTANRLIYSYSATKLSSSNVAISGYNLTSTTTTADSIAYKVGNSNGVISLYASVNRGLYDNTLGGWLIYLRASDSTLRAARSFYVDGTVTATNTISINRSTSIANNYSARLNFTVTQTDNNISATGYIACYDDLDANSYGVNMVVNATSGLYLTAGEGAAGYLSSNHSTAEDVHICADSAIYFHTNCNTTANATTSCYITTAGYIYGARVYGAVWNDYAEYRSQFENISAGRVAYCKNDGKLRITTERLQKFEGVVSDTFGFAIGETNNAKTPLAVSGRVLVYTYEPRDTFNSGDCVCAAPNGTVSKMSREEIVAYPDRIVGIVSEIPEYETWGTGDVPVNGRIWIKVK